MPLETDTSLHAHGYGLLRQVRGFVRAGDAPRRIFRACPRIETGRCRSEIPSRDRAFERENRARLESHRAQCRSASARQRARARLTPDCPPPPEPGSKRRGRAWWRVLRRSAEAFRARTRESSPTCETAVRRESADVVESGSCPPART